MNKKLEMPIWHKVLLNIEEAAAYSNLGINTIRTLVREPGCTFVVHNGNKYLIKRKEFEEFLSKSLYLR